MNKNIVLASSSKSRQSLLKRLLLPFIIAEPHVDETPNPNESPEMLVKRLALAKAKKVAPDFKNALIIACDQAIICDDSILGKPENYENAVEQLSQTSGKKVTSLTALCVLDTDSKQHRTTIEPFAVQMRVLTSEMIENYLRLEKPYHCAGSIQAESLGIALCESLEGRDYTALIGLPLIALCDLLAEFNISMLESNKV